MSIVFQNLDEFIKRIKAISKEYPGDAEKYLRRIGNKLKKQVQKNSPVGKADDEILKNGKKRRNKRKLKNSWTSKIVGSSGVELEYQLKTRAPHYHLVERGHFLIVRGRDKGFVQGKFFFKKTVESFERSNEIRSQMEKFMKELKKKIEGG